MITLESAARNTHRRVVYTSAAQREGRDRRPPEAGKIVRVGARFVFVDYGWGVAATDPGDLEYVGP